MTKIMKDQVFNSSELHIISGVSIEICRLIFKENYLPPRTSLDVIQKNYPDFNFHKAYDHFKTNWFKYHDNRDYMLDEPFTEKGFKVKRKVSFIMGILPEDQQKEITDLWERKKELLKRQLGF